MNWFKKKKSKALGVAHGKRQYDIPLTQKDGSGFLVLLVTLMSFLVLIVTDGAFLMSTLSSNWRSGLENKVTIEIPAEHGDGSIMTPEQLDKLGKRVMNLIDGHSIIEHAEMMKKEDIQNLISPWLGHDDTMLDTLPFPVLIAVELNTRDPKALKNIEEKIHKLAPEATLDTHEDWLNDLLRLTSALKYTAFFLSLMILMTTATAIAGAVRSSMSAHHQELELLHLMGSTDRYITRQFQRYIFILTAKGAGIASAVVFPILGLVYAFSDKESTAVLPSFAIEPIHFLFLALCPIAMPIFSVLIARWTVLRSLEEMP